MHKHILAAFHVFNTRPSGMQKHIWEPIVIGTRPSGAHKHIWKAFLFIDIRPSGMHKQILEAFVRHA